MTLYTQASRNVFKTYVLMMVFLVVVIGLGWIFSQYFGSPVILWIALIFSTVMAFVSYWHSDKIVLRMTGARQIAKKEDHPELYRIVENLAIASGLPMPRIYVIEEAAPNAFATGRDPKRGVVAVTRGLLDRLDRSELEGVIAHELAHIGNRDILISTVAVVLVGFISLIADIFIRSFWWGGARRNTGGSPVILILAIAAAILAPISAMLLQMAISRKREFLADATAALFTRNPEGLASALEKISSDRTPMRNAHSATAHLYIENPFKADVQRGRGVSVFAKLFSTHPPVEDRVKALRNSLQ